MNALASSFRRHTGWRFSFGEIGLEKVERPTAPAAGSNESVPGEDVGYEHDAAGQLIAHQPASGAACAGRRRAMSTPAVGRRVREASDDQASDDHPQLPLGGARPLTTIESDERTTHVSVDALGELADVGGTPFMWDTANPMSPLPCGPHGRTIRRSQWMGRSTRRSVKVFTASTPAIEHSRLG